LSEAVCVCGDSYQGGLREVQDMTESTRMDDGQRLRPHPEERFSTAQQLIDLRAAAADLAREGEAGPHRHRQKTLIRFGGTTVAMFHFSKGASMREHQTRGTVSIHVLEGRMTVNAAERRHTMAAGRLLVLAPEVKHDLFAEEESHMLLTVHLEG